MSSTGIINSGGGGLEAGLIKPSGGGGGGLSKEMRHARTAHNMSSSSLRKKSDVSLVSKVRCGFLRSLLANLQEIFLGTKLFVLFPAVPLAIVAETYGFGRVRSLRRLRYSNGSLVNWVSHSEKNDSFLSNSVSTDAVNSSAVSPLDSLSSLTSPSVPLSSEASMVDPLRGMDQMLGWIHRPRSGG